MIQLNDKQTEEEKSLHCTDLHLITKNNTLIILNSPVLNLRFIFCVQMICPTGKSLPNHTPTCIPALILMQVTQSIETQQRV